MMEIEQLIYEAGRLGLPAIAQKAMKMILRDLAKDTVRATVETEGEARALAAAAEHSKYAVEAVADFLEKRKPIFANR